MTGFEVAYFTTDAYGSRFDLFENVSDSGSKIIISEVSLYHLYCNRSIFLLDDMDYNHRQDFITLTFRNISWLLFQKFRGSNFSFNNFCPICPAYCA